jgi:3-oxoacyl-[acyl-carrier protein] reductase
MPHPVVLITGASHGLGRKMAVAFAKKGYAVGVNYFKSEPAARETAADVEKAGGKALLLKADVSHSSDVKKMFETVEAEWGRVDVLINNAGIVRNRTIAKMTDAEWKDVLAVLLDGVFFCTRQAIPLMRAHNGGSIVNITSFIAANGARGAANYAAAKAGVITFTKTTAQEEGKNNIRANAVLPGFHVTDMNKDVWERMGPDILKEHLLGKLPDADEMADFVVHIAQLRSVTGQVFAFESRLN